MLNADRKLHIYVAIDEVQETPERGGSDVDKSCRQADQGAAGGTQSCPRENLADIFGFNDRQTVSAIETRAPCSSVSFHRRHSGDTPQRLMWLESNGRILLPATCALPTRQPRHGI